jgi:hypothetical protein
MLPLDAPAAAAEEAFMGGVGEIEVRPLDGPPGSPDDRGFIATSQESTTCVEQHEGGRWRRRCRLAEDDLTRRRAPDKSCGLFRRV